ncbi:hypothetical protein PAHAL_9G512000 [Panicum hallii]|uniref:ADF-H domain-containing protein n=1 Tax=Panicum hallii TaxID=206008 RepID=A0A2S3IRV3_9POAL|nr:actin-depolymerizing factor 7-like isoform X3 [Panicum hallii]PAN50317.1 hypothetical protein PAHAL_9G512000 [Panicum hallii]
MANAASGMAVDDDCKRKFLELKAKRTYRFVVFRIDEKQKQVVVERLGEPNLPADECRYCVYDFDFVTEEGCQKSKIFFIAWSPDTAKIRSKMLYASSKDKFKRELDGIQVQLQATDPSEMGLDVIRGPCQLSVCFLGPAVEVLDLSTACLCECNGSLTNDIRPYPFLFHIAVCTC